MSTVYFLGAGASFGTLRRIGESMAGGGPSSLAPTAAGFGRALSALKPGWRSEWKALSTAVDLAIGPSSEWDLESVWTFIDYYAKLAYDQQGPAILDPVFGRLGELRVSQELHHALYFVYGEVLERACDTNQSSLRGCALADLLQGLGAGDAVVSFNYDRLAELILSLRGVSHTLMPDVGSGTSVTVFKPHGCVSQPRSRALDPIASDQPLPEYTEDMEPILLGAVPIKSELIPAVQRSSNTPGVSGFVRSQWRGVFESVASADRIVACGYSFPKEDQYGSFILRQAGRERAAQCGPDVEFYEVPALKSETYARIADVFGNARPINIRFCGPLAAAQPGTDVV